MNDETPRTGANNTNNNEDVTSRYSKDMSNP